MIDQKVGQLVESDKEVSHLVCKIIYKSDELYIVVAVDIIIPWKRTCERKI
jgi:hypothetical protein